MNMDFIKTHKNKLMLLVSSVVFLKFSSLLIDRIRAYRFLRQARRHLASRNAKKTALQPISESDKKKILKLHAYHLEGCYRSKDLTVTQVLEAFISQAQTVGRDLHLSAEELFQEALSSVNDLRMGRLYGIPISVKDEFFQLGCHTSGGLIRNLSIPDTKESIMVTLVKEAGGVPIVRGNLMQLSLWVESTNPIYGRAENPWDRTRTTGGSSGGDAGLVASGSVLLTVSSDIGGSIRLPAAFCGVYGFKPSSLRTSLINEISTHPTASSPIDNLVRASVGTMSSCVEDIKLMLETWWTERLWKADNIVVPLHFNAEKYCDTQRLRIGVFDYNGVFECAVAVKKAVREAADVMKKNGHEVVEFNADMFDKGAELYVRAVFGVDQQFLIDELQGEDPEWPYMPDYLEYKIPGLSLVSKKLLWLAGFKKLYQFLSKTKPMSLIEFGELQREITEFRANFNAYWQSLNIDALICPIWPLVAPHHETTLDLAPAITYSFMWNLVDFPAGVIPVKKIQPGEDFYESTVKDAYVKVAQETMRDSIGMPISIQIVSAPYEDETALRVMKELQDHFGFFEKRISPA